MKPITSSVQKQSSVLYAVLITAASFFGAWLHRISASTAHAKQSADSNGPTKIFVDKHSTSNIEFGTSAEPYHSIQAGIDNAVKDDTVVVLDGMYAENITIDKEITLQVKNLQQATNMGTVTIHDSNVSVKGFVIDGSESPADTAGVVISAFSGFNGSATISGNEIKNFNQGVLMDYNDPENKKAILIRWNYIHRNEIGINVDAAVGGAAVEITNNNIKYNKNGIHTSARAVVLSHNNVLVNDNALINYSDEKQNAKYNWWGDEDGPATTNTKNNSVTTDADFPNGSVDYSPWLCDPIEYNPGNSLGGCDDEEEETTSRLARTSVS